MQAYYQISVCATKNSSLLPRVKIKLANISIHQRLSKPLK